MARFEILQWLYGPEKFPGLSRNGPQVQRHSGFEWLCKLTRLRPEPIRFVRLDSEHAQSDGKSVNRGLLECVIRLSC